MSLPAISIIGMGNVGSALHKACEQAGYPIKSLFNRSGSDDPNITAGIPDNSEELGDLIFLTVSDSAIEQVSHQLSMIKGELKNRCIVHCSGTLSSDVLSILRNKGCSTASFHPMMAVKSDTSSFRGIYFDGEGDIPCMKILRDLSKDLKSEFIEVEGDKRKFLHAASVMASNYLVTLADTASVIGARTGQPRHTVLKALLPLMKSTIRNLEGGNTKDALTGPISRGDKEVIQEHLKDLPETSAEGRLYRIMGLYTLGLISHEEAEKLKGLFS